jgi:uncharacterized protein YqjF (DUF2071 family)
MTQSWHEPALLALAGERAAAAAAHPAAFDLDRFDGRRLAGRGAVHHEPRGAARRAAGALVLAFPELNVRTYVSPRDGKRGVYFFSLDAARLAAVLAARAMFRLPYFPASMQVTGRGEGVHYVSRRRGGSASFVGSYAPTGPAFNPARGTLEFFLTERYCLYHTDLLGRPARLEIHHAPWQLQTARAEISENTMADPLGIPLEGAPLLHFAKRQDVVTWWTRPLRI